MQELAQVDQQGRNRGGNSVREGCDDRAETQHSSMTLRDRLTVIISLADILSLSLQAQLELFNDPLILARRHKLTVNHPSQDLAMSMLLISLSIS